MAVYNHFSIDTDDAAQMVASQVYPANQSFVFTVPNVAGPWLDASGLEYDQGTVQVGYYATGGTAPTDISAMTTGEFALITVAAGKANTEPSVEPVVVAAATNLDAGIYDFDSTAAGFTVTLTEEIGIWDFSNVKQTAGTNQILIGTALQTFTDNAGVQQNGPFSVDVDGAAFRIMNVAGGTAFLVVEEVIPVLTGNLLANGGWDASTNTPDLTLAASQGDGTNVYTYLIAATGTQDIGDGSLSYEAGGQITFFDQPGAGATFRYDSVAASGLRQNPVADLTALAAVAATDAMHQTVLDDGSGNRAEYVFNLGKTPIGTDVADGGATGAWVKTEVLGTVASDEIGTLKQVPNVDESGAAMTNADYVAKGLLPLVNGYTLTDGATNNPKFALMFPTFVSGNNLVVPSNIGGDFVRNLGGNAAAFMTFQANQNKEHFHIQGIPTVGGGSTGPDWAKWGQTFVPEASGGGKNVVAGSNQARNDDYPYTNTEGGVDARPDNFAMQFCLVLDSYSRVLMVDPNLVPVDDQAASGYIDIGTTRIQWADGASASGGTVVFSQPFASTPVITATSTQNSGHNISVLTKSATQFTFDQWDIEDVQQNGTWNWIAIGVKP